MVLWVRESSVTLGVHKPRFSDVEFSEIIRFRVERPRGVGGAGELVVQWRRGIERYDGARSREFSIVADRYAYEGSISYVVDPGFEYALRASLVDRWGRVVGVAEATARRGTGAHPVGPTRASRVDAGGLALLPGATWMDVVWSAAAGAAGYTLQWKPASVTGWDSAEEAVAGRRCDRPHHRGGSPPGPVTRFVYTPTPPPAGPAGGSGPRPRVWCRPGPCSCRWRETTRRSWCRGCRRRVPEAGSVTGYALQWRLDDESYDDTRRRLMAVSTYEAEITGLDNSVDYTVRLSAMDSAGRTLGSAEGTVRTVSMADYIGTRIVEPRAGIHPWLREAWYEVPVEVRPGRGNYYVPDRSRPVLASGGPPGRHRRVARVGPPLHAASLDLRRRPHRAALGDVAVAVPVRPPKSGDRSQQRRSRRAQHERQHPTVVPTRDRMQR